MGILPAQALATSVILDTEYAWDVPDNWSLADAATVPVVYATAYYALVMRGRIRKGDKVYIQKYKTPVPTHSFKICYPIYSII